MNIKRIILLFSIIIMALAAYFYISSEVTRKTPSMIDSQEDLKVEASNLIKEFESNSVQANQKYLGKIILIEGNLKAIETNEKGFYTLVLGNSSSMSSVRCSMENSIGINSEKFPIGSYLHIRGECTGFNPDDLGLGADVVLNRSVIIKTN